MATPSQLHDQWLAELVGGPIPDEVEATCDACAMCRAEGAAEPGEHELAFNPRTKCCTYLPLLPNFLVGRILEDDDPTAAAGRLSVLTRIEQGLGVTPLGLAPTRLHSLQYDGGKARVFGRSLALRCPHYIEEAGGSCGIWRHRNGVCRTWFCKHVRGATGRRFWDTIQRLLTGIEAGLARWCLLELGVSSSMLRQAVAAPARRADHFELDEVDATPSPKLREQWGEWHDRKENFYRACARAVSNLPASRVLQLGGSEVAVLRELARADLEALTSDELPQRLQTTPYTVVRADRDHVRLRTYSAYDPVEIPRALAEALPRFEGCSPAEGIERIADELGLRMDEVLVRRLVDFGLLR